MERSTTDSATGLKHTIKLFGSTVRYWEYNPEKRTTIVMIHGFRGTHHGLQYIVDHLPQYRIIAPDLPGFDASSPMHERQHTIRGYRDFVEAFIVALQLKKPYLLGHSFGTIVVAATAAHSPKLIKKLIMINTIASPASKAALAWAAEFYYWLGQRLPEKPARALLGNPVIIKFMSHTLTTTRDKAMRATIHQQHLRHFSTFRDRRALDQAFRASMSHTAMQYADDIHVPTLLIAGEQDAIAPPEGQERLLSRLSDGTLVTIKGVGHLIHYEKPAEAAAAIRRFIG